MPKKKLKLPSKREREKAFVTHNVNRLLTSATEVRSAAFVLEKAMKKLVLHADAVQPFLKNGGGK